MDKIKVLYVEDEPFLAKIVKESLESRNYVVELVSDGNLAFAAFQSFQPNICVLDVMLPNKDGFILAKEIRKKEPQTPIIFLTAKTQTQDLVEGFESGGNDYVKKPFSMEELIVRINNLLQLTRPSIRKRTQGESIPIGKYTFHPHKYELRYDRQLKKLSHRESQLLKILIDHTNSSVDRKEILTKIWGDDSFFNSRNLDVYITKLRNYLKHDPGIQIITLKGIGYHFVVDA